MPFYLAAFVPSAFQIGLVPAAYSLAHMLGIPCGVAADRVGKTKVIFFVLFFLAFTALAFTVSRSVWHFAAMFFLVGILANFYYSTINALVTIYFRQKVEGLFRMEAMYQLGLAVGLIVAVF